MMRFHKIISLMAILILTICISTQAVAQPLDAPVTTMRVWQRGEARLCVQQQCAAFSCTAEGGTTCRIMCAKSDCVHDDTGCLAFSAFAKT